MAQLFVTDEKSEALKVWLGPELTAGQWQGQI